MVVGLLEGLAEKFGEKISVEQEAIGPMGGQQRFLISFV